MAKELLPQLKEGKVVRGWLGVMIQEITPELKDKLDLEDQKGALVAGVSPSGPAEKAGIKRGDVIVSFDGKAINEMHELPYMVATTPVGKQVSVEVIRKGRKKTIEVKTGELQEQGESQTADKGKPWLGMDVKEITPDIARRFGLSETRGLIVVEVEGNTPAEEAGISPGDIILEIDQIPVKDLEQFNQKMHAQKTGDTILFLVKRGNSTLYLTLRVEK
jgi:serine protease Do